MPGDGCNMDLPAATKALLCKNKEGGRSARAWPVAAPMPKSDSFFGKKKECLVLTFSFLRTFHRWGGYVFIMYIVPNLRFARILSYWMRYFLPLSN